MKYTIAPSLPAQSFAEIESLLTSLNGVATEIQIDLVDGKFAPFVSWPFTEVQPMSALKALQPFMGDFSFGMDCMVQHPEQYLDEFVALGVDRVVIHMRSTDAYEEIIAHARAHGYKIAFALVSSVPLSELEPYIAHIDFVQLMGIKAIGQQGQPFDEETLVRARMLRDAHPQLDIAVDGSVNAQTIVRLKEAGVNRFAPGSAIAKNNDPAAAFVQLQQLIASA